MVRKKSTFSSLVVALVTLDKKNAAGKTKATPRFRFQIAFNMWGNNAESNSVTELIQPNRCSIISTLGENLPERRAVERNVDKMSNDITPTKA